MRRGGIRRTETSAPRTQAEVAARDVKTRVAVSYIARRAREFRDELVRELRAAGYRVERPGSVEVHAGILDSMVSVRWENWSFEVLP